MFLMNRGIKKGAILTGYPDAYLAIRDGNSIQIRPYNADTTNNNAINLTGAGDCTTGSFAALYLVTQNAVSSFKNACKIAEMSTSVEGGVYTPDKGKVTQFLSS